MITALAEVVENHQGYVVVRCQKSSNCNSCTSKSSCGVGTLSKALSNKAVTVEIPCDAPITVGSLIEIGIKEDVLLKSAIHIYLLPLVFVILTALLVDLFTHNEFFVIIASIFIAIVSLWLAKIKMAKLEKQLASKPVLLRVIS